MAWTVGFVTLRKDVHEVSTRELNDKYDGWISEGFFVEDTL